MSLLSQLLQRALVKRPSQVIIETDRPVVVITDRGTQEQGKELEGDAVFDALFDVLSEEQQAELVVGKVVEFEFAAGSRSWQVVTETATDKISLRARLRPQLVEDIPVDDLEDEEDDARARGVVSGVLDGDDEDEEDRERDELVVIVDAEEVSRAGLAEDEIDVDVDEPDEAVALGQHRGVATVTSLHKTSSVVAFAPSGERGGKPDGGSRGRDARGLFKRFSRRGHAERDRLVTTVSAGTLCYVLRGVGLGQALAEALDLPIVRLREGDTTQTVQPRLAQLSDEGVILLTVEDPSPWLPWILRRLEEGRRVLIETGARTPAGARRTLLGVTATARAESWLACMRTASATRSGGHWNLSVDEA